MVPSDNHSGDRCRTFLLLQGLRKEFRTIFDKAIELEKILIRRVKKRYREGKVRDETADFFEEFDKCNEIFVMMTAKKGKLIHFHN